MTKSLVFFSCIVAVWGGYGGNTTYTYVLVVRRITWHDFHGVFCHICPQGGRAHNWGTDTEHVTLKGGLCCVLSVQAHDCSLEFTNTTDFLCFS